MSRHTEKQQAGDDNGTAEILDAVISLMPHGLVIEGPDGEILRMNEAAARLLGYSGEAPPARTLEEHLVNLHVDMADGRPFSTEYFPTLRALKGQAALGIPLILHLPDGKDVWLLLSSVPVVNPEGEIVGAIHAFTDITPLHSLRVEREALLEEVSRKAAETDAIIASSPHGIVIYDPEGHPVRMNEAAEAISGYDFDFLSTTSVEERVRLMRQQMPDGRDMAPEENPAQRALSGETVRNFRHKLTQPSGRVVWISAAASPIIGRDGKNYGVVAAFDDISDVYELMQERQQMLDIVSHEVRNPLTAILGEASFLANALKDTRLSEEREHARAVLDHTYRIDAMVRDLLDDMRIHAGQLTLQPADIDLCGLIRSVISKYAVAVAMERVRLEDCGEIRVLADPDRLDRVLLNLLNNALLHSPAEVRVSVSDGPDAAVCVISGDAIPIEELAGVFEGYARDETESPEPTGQRFRLFIAKLLIEAQGGRIWLEDQSGQPCGFCLSLPRPR